MSAFAEAINGFAERALEYVENNQLAYESYPNFIRTRVVTRLVGEDPDASQEGCRIGRRGSSVWCAVSVAIWPRHDAVARKSPVGYRSLLYQGAGGSVVPM